MNLKETGYEDMGCIQLTEYRDQWLCCVNMIHSDEEP
jgi:hypothetical protein